ncbi:hypothetical protein Fmac_010873 [Flemingia macrophylla]|uniref:Uncharacterized protein n=1 Tax=Flemingia macrophylla TaxID=520843 RepID=A0ABD1MKV3_9FABA
MEVGRRNKQAGQEFLRLGVEYASLQQNRGSLPFPRSTLISAEQPPFRSTRHPVALHLSNAHKRPRRRRCASPKVAKVPQPRRVEPEMKFLLTPRNRRFFSCEIA